MNARTPRDIWEDNVALAQAAAKGHPAAQKRFIVLVTGKIRKTMVYMSANVADVDDLTQAALIEILKSAGSYRGDSSLDFWAERIAVRTAAKIFEKRRRREGILAGLFHSSDHGLGLEESADSDRARERLSELLGLLNHKYRVPLILRYIREYSVDEVSELLECKKNTTRGLLRRGMRQLKKTVLTDPLLKDWLGRRDK